MASVELPDEFDECSLTQTSGEVTFVDVEHAQTFDCPICWEKLTNAVAVCEDHLFCESCVGRITSSDPSYFSCPVCRRKCNRHEVKRVKFIDRQIKNLMIKCPNHEITPLKSIYLRNCNLKNTKKRDDNKARSRSREKERSPSARSRSRSRSASHKDDDNDNDDNHNNNKTVIEFCLWSGKLNELAAHIAQCAFEIVRCAQCGDCIERGRKEVHNAECNMYRIKCKQCKENVPRKYMNEHKSKECLWTMIKCGNCDKTVMRKEINMHYNQCPEAVISCEFYQYGCEAMSLKRKNLAKHLEENIKMHLNLVCKYTQRLEKENVELSDKIDSIDNKLEALDSRVLHLERLNQYNFGLMGENLNI